MRAKQINDIIHEQTQGFFKEEGFKYIKKELGYFKNVNNATINYGFSYLEYHPQYKYEIDTFVRLNQVEEIFAKIDGSGIIGYTYVFPMSYFLDSTNYIGNNPRYLIEKEEDIPQFSKRLIDDYKNYVKEFIPFITKPQNMLDFLLKEIATGKPYAAKEPNKLERALILMKLLNYPDFDMKLEEFKNNIKGYLPVIKDKHYAEMDDIAKGNF